MNRYIKRKSDNVVFYEFPPGTQITFDSNGLVAPFKSKHITEEEFESFDANPPTEFHAKNMTYSDSWAIVDQSLVDTYNAEKQALLEEETERAKQVEVKVIESDFEAEVAQITSGYSQSEIDSWPNQLEEALAWQADNNANTPLMDAAIAQNGRTKSEHAGRILTNSALYKVAFGNALGKKQKRLADL